MGLFDKFADIIRENDDDEFDDFYEEKISTEDIDEATIQSEIDNAISKFSMEVKVTE